MKKVYRWKSGARWNLQKADVEKVAREIDLLQKQRGTVTAPDVLERAKDSPVLHPLFEWENAKAAEQYRLEQARLLVRSIVVVVHDEDSGEDREVRAFVSFEPEEPEEGSRMSYVDVKSGMSDPGISDQVLERAWEELLRWKQRYEHLKDFAEVCQAIDKTRRRT